MIKIGRSWTLLVIPMVCAGGFLTGRALSDGRVGTDEGASGSPAPRRVHRLPPTRFQLPRVAAAAKVDMPRSGAGGAGFEPRPPSRFHVRAAEEWQGMLIDVAFTPPCYEGFCQNALACIANQCGPCESDSQCLTGEACVLDHCILAEHVACRHARECSPRETCMLTGLSEDLRGNADLKSVCSGAIEVPDQASMPSLPPEAFIGGPSVASRLGDAMARAAAAR
jgi:hypothetical protein